MSWPANRIAPAAGLTTPRMALPSVDFPDPLSPTTPSVSPAATPRDTADSAVRSGWPRPRRYVTVRSRTSSRFGESVIVHFAPRLVRIATGARRSGVPRGSRRGHTSVRPLGSARGNGTRLASDRVGNGARDRRQRLSREREVWIRRKQRRRVRVPRVGVQLVDGGVSTTSPAYMTTARSHMSASTPQSWVMSRTAMPSRCCRSRSSPRISAWTVTSSAVVGSSAISSFGPAARAMAMQTRCAMPPDSSPGRLRRTAAASGNRTSCSSRNASALASRRDCGRCRRMTSRSWLPTVNVGSRLFAGSWDINAMPAPRIELSSFSRSRSSPGRRRRRCRRR